MKQHTGSPGPPGKDCVCNAGQPGPPGPLGDSHCCSSSLY